MKSVSSGSTFVSFLCVAGASTVGLVAPLETPTSLSTKLLLQLSGDDKGLCLVASKDSLRFDSCAHAHAAWRLEKRRKGGRGWDVMDPQQGRCLQRKNRARSNQVHSGSAVALLPCGAPGAARERWTLERIPAAPPPAGTPQAGKNARGSGWWALVYHERLPRRRHLCLGPSGLPRPDRTPSLIMAHTRNCSSFLASGPAGADGEWWYDSWGDEVWAEPRTLTEPKTPGQLAAVVAPPESLRAGTGAGTAALAEQQAGSSPVAPALPKQSGRHRRTAAVLKDAPSKLGRAARATKRTKKTPGHGPEKGAALKRGARWKSFFLKGFRANRESGGASAGRHRRTAAVRAIAKPATGRRRAPRAAATPTTDHFGAPRPGKKKGERPWLVRCGLEGREVWAAAAGAPCGAGASPAAKGRLGQSRGRASSSSPLWWTARS
mmetsp:Transcript_10022/g.23053  ORF Transcript_10022/g.23053 Transcript_10022/m.23053 type:complete len:435 (+) Transcript_10022:85-1389(+)